MAEYYTMKIAGLERKLEKEYNQKVKEIKEKEAQKVKAEKQKTKDFIAKMKRKLKEDPKSIDELDNNQ